ncbi:MAG: hypothetical protein RQ936_01025 [Gammaproteobacteria bacterium]|nr:hypothetical protein [Gammaproteobacteria bacterium]
MYDFTCAGFFSGSDCPAVQFFTSNAINSITPSTPLELIGFTGMNNNNEIIIESAAFDVSSDNYESFDQAFDPSKLGEKLVQENARKGTVREYQLYASRHLLLNFTGKKKAAGKKFRVNLAYVSAEPAHIKVIQWNWLYGVLVSAALLGLFIFLGIEEVFNLEYCLIGAAITSTTSAISTLIFIYLMRDEYIFRSRFGNIELFLMDNGKPNQKEFDEFFTRLRDAIKHVQLKQSVADGLVEELKMCRRLKDEGIIDEARYTLARTAIFKHKQYQA